jgi:hypothetical protein
MTKPLRLAVYLRLAWSLVRAATVQLIGLAGVAAIIEGVRQIYHPAALIVGGALAVLWTILKVRSP